MTNSAGMRAQAPRVWGKSERCDFRWKRKRYCAAAPARMTPNRVIF